MDAAQAQNTFQWDPVHARWKAYVPEGKQTAHWVCKLCKQTKAGDKSKFVSHILGPKTVLGTKQYYKNQRMGDAAFYAYSDVKLLRDDLNTIKSKDCIWWQAPAQRTEVFAGYVGICGGIVAAMG